MKEIPLKILIIDDEKDIYPLFEQQFKEEIKKNLYTFSYAHSGEEALELLKNLPHPDLALILADISMPGMSGLELLKLLKEEYPLINIFMITAYGDYQNSQLAFKLGAKEVISKPIHFPYLKKQIFQFMEEMNEGHPSNG